MDKNKIHSFMDNLNLLLVGAVLGCFVGACFMSNYHIIDTGLIKLVMCFAIFFQRIANLYLMKK